MDITITRETDTKLKNQHINEIKDIVKQYNRKYTDVTDVNRILLYDKINDKDDEILINNYNKLYYDLSRNSSTRSDKIKITMHVLGFQTVRNNSIKSPVQCVYVNLEIKDNNLSNTSKYIYSFLIYDYTIKKKASDFKLITVDLNPEYLIDENTRLSIIPIKKDSKIYTVYENNKTRFITEHTNNVGHIKRIIDITFNDSYNIIEGYDIYQNPDPAYVEKKNFTLQYNGFLRSDKYYQRIFNIKKKLLYMNSSPHKPDYRPAKNIINNRRSMTDMVKLYNGNYSSFITINIDHANQDNELPDISISFSDELTNLSIFKFVNNQHLVLTSMNFVSYVQDFILNKTLSYTNKKNTYKRIILNLVESINDIEKNNDFLQYLKSLQETEGFEYEPYNIEKYKDLDKRDELKNLTDSNFSIKNFIEQYLISNKEEYKISYDIIFSYTHNNGKMYKLYSKYKDEAIKPIYYHSGDDIFYLEYDESKDYNIDELVKSKKFKLDLNNDTEYYFEHGNNNFRKIDDNNDDIKKKINMYFIPKNFNRYLIVFLDNVKADHKNNLLKKIMLSQYLYNLVFIPRFIILKVDKDTNNDYYISISRNTNNNWLVFDPLIKEKINLKDYDFNFVKPVMVIYEKKDLADDKTNIEFTDIVNPNDDSVYYYSNTNYEHLCGLESLVYHPKNYTVDNIMGSIKNTSTNSYYITDTKTIDHKKFMGSIKTNSSDSTDSVINFHTYSYINKFISKINKSKLDVNKIQNTTEEAKEISNDDN